MAAVGVFCASSQLIEARFLDLAHGESGARTLGVIPQALVDLEVADTNADELIVTAAMAERKTIMIEKADAFITLPGGLGTLDELFEVWTLATLTLHEKPVVLLDPDGFYGGLLDWLDGLAAQRFVRREALGLLRVARDVPGAFKALEEETWTR